MKWAIAQINTCMGNVTYNQKKIASFLEMSGKENVDVTIFPELSLVGYPPKDHILQKGFIDKIQGALKELMQQFPKQSFILGSILQDSSTRALYNAALWISGGKLRDLQKKSLLPTYDIFDERRYFEASFDSRNWDIAGLQVGVSICEDMWSPVPGEGHPRYEYHRIKELQHQGANLIVNISASPFYVGKHNLREKIIQSWVKEFKEPFIFANMVGGNDEILFDGCSFVMSHKGEIISRAEAFTEDLLTFDPLNPEYNHHAAWPQHADALRAKALVMGIRDYIYKCGVKDVLLGLSGGIDSALVALLAVEALGKEHVTLVFMPSEYSSEMSREDARAIAQKLGTPYFELPIDGIRNSFDETLKETFKGLPRDVTEENIQARARGTLLMALSNKMKSFLLTTGNKSEVAVGYCTLYGDMAGGLAVISDLYKNEVYSTARWLNQTYRAIPERVFTRAPSAELRPGQKDQDSLPPYEVLDKVVELYVEDYLNEAQIIAQGYEAQAVKKIIRLVDGAEFKRQQAAPGLKVSPKAFGLGRRMPIARGPQ